MYRIRHKGHPPVFLVTDNNVVRWIGPTEMTRLADVEKATPGTCPLIETTDTGEYDRLVCAAYALMGLDPPTQNRP